MPLFSKQPADSLQLVIDVESDLVRAAFVLFPLKGAPRIMATASELVTKKSHTDGAYLTRTMLKKLARISEAAALDGRAKLTGLGLDGRALDAIHIMLSSPWIVSRLSCFEEKFERETALKHSTIARFVDKEKTAMTKLFAQGDSMVVDMKLLEVKTNGYPVQNYEGKRARSIEGTLAVSVASRKLLSEIKSAVNRSFRTRADERIHSAAFLQYAALRALYPHRADYAWIHVHGELTDIIVVRGSACSLQGSLPFGSETFMRKMARAMGESTESIASLFSLAEKKSLSAERQAAFQNACPKILGEWARGLGELAATGGAGLPAAAILSVRSGRPFFEEALQAAYPGMAVEQANLEKATVFAEYAPPAEPSISLSMYAMALRHSEPL